MRKLKRKTALKEKENRFLSAIPHVTNGWTFYIPCSTTPAVDECSIFVVGVFIFVGGFDRFAFFISPQFICDNLRWCCRLLAGLSTWNFWRYAEFAAHPQVVTHVACTLTYLFFSLIELFQYMEQPSWLGCRKFNWKANLTGVGSRSLT